MPQNYQQPARNSEPPLTQAQIRDIEAADYKVKNLKLEVSYTNDGGMDAQNYAPAKLALLMRALAKNLQEAADEDSQVDSLSGDSLKALQVLAVLFAEGTRSTGPVQYEAVNSALHGRVNAQDWADYMVRILNWSTISAGIVFKFDKALADGGLDELRSKDPINIFDEAVQLKQKDPTKKIGDPEIEVMAGEVRVCIAPDAPGFEGKLKGFVPGYKIPLVEK